MRTRLTPEVIRLVVDLIPDRWLDGEPGFASNAEHRQAYADFLLSRLEASHVFVEEAQNAHTQIV